MRAQPAKQDQNQKSTEQVQTLSTGPVPEVKLAPVTVVGQTPGADFDTDVHERDVVDVSDVAPVVADATRKNKPRDGEEDAPKAEIFYRVMATKFVLVDGARVQLKEGKEISSKHYNIRSLQKQGLKLKKFEQTESDEPLDLED